MIGLYLIAQDLLPTAGRGRYFLTPVALGLQGLGFPDGNRPFDAGLWNLERKAPILDFLGAAPGLGSLCS